MQALTLVEGLLDLQRVPHRCNDPTHWRMEFTERAKNNIVLENSSTVSARKAFIAFNNIIL